MLEPIYNRYGKVVAWFDGETGDVFNRYGQALGFVDGDAYYTYRGRYLGEFDGGIFWDRCGRAICFLEGATGGPFLPIAAIPPIPPIPGLAPLRPPTHQAPAPPPQLPVWSHVQFVRAFEG